MSAQSSGSHRSPCTVAMLTVQLAPTAASPETLTVPGMDSAARASTPPAKGTQSFTVSRMHDEDAKTVLLAL